MPDTVNISDTFGWIYYKRAAYRSAIELPAECMNKEPQNATVCRHLGMSHSKNGDERRAKNSLSQAIKLDSNYPQTIVIQSIIGNNQPGYKEP